MKCIHCIIVNIASSYHAYVTSPTLYCTSPNMVFSDQLNSRRAAPMGIASESINCLRRFVSQRQQSSPSNVDSYPPRWFFAFVSPASATDTSLFTTSSLRRLGMFSFFSLHFSLSPTRNRYLATQALELYSLISRS